MDAERWRQVEQLYHAAIELEGDKRNAFLDRECTSDQALRAELDSLIAYSQQTGRIIDKPALDAVVGAMAEELRAQTARSHIIEKTLAPGTQLGDFEVKSLLGSGGMGQVYRARDSRLVRDVAIKVLPSFLSADSDRLRRFDQEARAAAALNHPNILAVYQMGTYEGAPYLVSELLEGETLREKIKRGRLSVRKAIDYGVQIARGLAAAQEKDIVHRDLKPENLFVSKDGHVKILDFGLAKLVEPQSTTECPQGTETGVVMGTVGYMSPEQLRGQPADYRTDIFALGVILYEMLTGKRPFQKPTSADTTSAILNEDPSAISRVADNIPPALQKIVRRCLEKSPEQRFQSASDLAFALDALPETSRSTALWRRKDRDAGSSLNFVAKHKLTRAVGLVMFGLLLGAVLYRFIIRGGGDHRIMQSQATFSGDAHAPAISPDGLSVAYVSRKFGEPDKLIHQALPASNGATLELARATELGVPRWSPNGSELLFSKYEPEPYKIDRNSAEVPGIFMVSRLGGSVRPIFRGDYACWFAPDGSEVVTASAREHDRDFKGVRLVNTLTGEVKEVPLSGYSELWDIDCSASTGLILAVTGISGKHQIRTFRSDGSEEHKLLETDDRIYSARWSPAGDSIYYLHGRGSKKELSKVLASGSADPLVDCLQCGRFFTLSASGSLLAFTREPRHWNLWRIDLPAAAKKVNPEISRLTSGTSAYGKPNFSPDGRWMVFANGPNRDETNIFKMPVAGGQSVQLTFLKHAGATNPVWSPDGQRIAFIGNQSGTPKVWTISANGGSARLLEHTDASNTHNQLAWWPGSNIVYQQPENQNLLVINDRTQEETPLIPRDRAKGFIVSPVFAPDGKRMAVQWRRDEAALWIISLEPYSETLLQSGEINPLGWSPDGSYVYGIRGGREIVRVRVATPNDVTVVAILPGDGNDAGLSPDGKEIVVSVSEEESDVWLMQNFDRNTP